MVVEKTGKIKENRIDTTECDSVHSDVIQFYKVRKQLRLAEKGSENVRLIILLENDYQLRLINLKYIQQLTIY